MLEATCSTAQKFTGVSASDVAKAMDYLAHQPGLDGRAFHLTDPEPMRVGEVLLGCGEPAEETSETMLRMAAALGLPTVDVDLSQAGLRPVGPIVWRLSGPGAGVLWAVYAAGWALVLSSTFGVSHFDLFGLRQAWLSARRVTYSPPPFTEVLPTYPVRITPHLDQELVHHSAVAGSHRAIRTGHALPATIQGHCHCAQHLRSRRGRDAPARAPASLEG